MKHLLIKTHLSSSFKCIVLLSVMLTFLSCQKNAPELEKQVFVNTFLMELNGEKWQPGISEEDACRQRFNGAWSFYNSRPYFTVTASTDHFRKTSAGGKLFEIQFKEVSEKGRYFLTGTYREHAGSYALYLVTAEDGNSVRYINKENSNTFRVDVEEIRPVAGSSLSTINGTFQGTLYREDNPQDSLIINSGSFEFNRPNRYSFFQCAE
jgi:hypothetical protein